LATRQGLLDFSISVVLERDLKDKSAPMTYHFVKKVGGFPKEMNLLAAQGYRFTTGRRLGSILMAVLAKQSSDGTTYTVSDEDKYQKEFDKTIAQGNAFQGIIVGDMTCGSTEAIGEKMIFRLNRPGEKHDYKLLPVAYAKTGGPSPESLAAIHQLLEENYQIKDLFVQRGLHIVFEK